MALIAGTLGADVINGTNADDTLLGYPEGTDASAETANDTISGSGGNDFEYGGGGNDQLNGGAGDDWLHGQNGSDLLVGDAGYDHLFGGDGNDVLHGGTPTSVLQDGAGNSLNGEGGNDALYSLLGAGVDTIDGGDGEDYAGIVRSSATVGLTFQMTSVSGVTTLIGDGTTVSNVEQIDITTGDGADLITTLAGADYIDAGGGNDILSAGAGDDIVSGGAGNDILNGGSGVDAMGGGTGDDTYVIDDVADSIEEEGPGGGSDLVQSSISFTLGSELENLTLTGAVAIDATGNSLNNVLTGNAATNVLRGSGGNDSASASAGNDTVFGGAGADVESGDSGRDTMFVILGANTLTFANDSHFDYVVGYKPGVDTFDLTSVWGLDNFADLSMQTVGNGVLVSYGFGGFFLRNTSIGSVEQGDFLLNDRPVAVHDVAAGEENQTLTIDVLGNDVDTHGGHTLTLNSVAAPPGQGSATIANNQLEFNPGSDFDHLAVGETTTVTLDYGIEDEHGAASASTVTVTVTGTNDAPIVSAEAGDSAGTAVPLVETDAGLSVSGTLTVTDPDLSDTVALTVHGVQVTGSAGSLTNAQLLSLFSIAPASLAADGDVTNNLAWSFDSGNEAFDFLAAGEQLTLSYTIRAVDDSLTGNNIGDGVVTIHIVGTNDGPVAVHDVAAGEENQTLTIDALGNDTDADGGHALTLVSVGAPSGQGSATIVGNQLVFNPGNDFEHLAVGETATVTLDYGIEDEHGAASASTVTVTVTGTNDAPIVSAEVGDSAGTAVPLVETNAGLSVSGTLTVTDPDLSDTVALTVHGVQVTGSAGSLTNAQLLAFFSIAPASLAADGDITNNLAWSFDSGNEAFDFLAAGEQLTLSYTIRAVDDSLTGNNIGDGVVTIQIVGSTDTDPAPTVTFVQESLDPTAVTLVSTGTTTVDQFGATAITPDGHYAVFGGGHEFFVRDLFAGTTTSLSPSLAFGTPTSISADGRYVAFTTDRALVAADTNGLSDGYVYDTQTSTVKLASSSSAGAVGTGLTSSPVTLTADGQYAVFYSFSSFTSADQNGF